METKFLRIHPTLLTSWYERDPAASCDGSGLSDLVGAVIITPCGLGLKLNRRYVAEIIRYVLYSQAP